MEFVEKIKGKYWLVAIIFLFWASLYMYVPILPVYAASLKNSVLGTAGLIVSMYGLTQFLLRIPLGITSDKLNNRKLFVMLGLALSLVAAIGMGFSSSILGVAAYRGVSGIAAATWVIISVLFATHFSQGSIVKATGIAVFISVFAQLFSSLAGGFVADYFGYLAPFIGAAILAGIGLLCLPFFNEKEPSQKINPAQENSKFNLGWYLVLISLAAAVGQFIMYATTYGYIPILAKQMGASSAQLGWLAAIMQLAYMIAAFGVGIFVSPRYEKMMAVIGIGLIGIASFWVLQNQTVNDLFLNRFIYGIGHGLSYPVLMGLAIKPVANHYRVTAMGIFQAIYAFGMFAGPAISGWIVGRAGLSVVFSTCGWIAIASIPIMLLAYALPVEIISPAVS